jgi:hypothetical protein
MSKQGVVIGFMDEQSVGLNEVGYAHTAFCSCQLGCPFCSGFPRGGISKRWPALLASGCFPLCEFPIAGVCLDIGQVDRRDGRAQLVIVEAKPERH